MVRNVLSHPSAPFPLGSGFFCIILKTKRLERLGLVLCYSEQTVFIQHWQFLTPIPVTADRPQAGKTGMLDCFSETPRGGVGSTSIPLKWLTDSLLASLASVDVDWAGCQPGLSSHCCWLVEAVALIQRRFPSSCGWLHCFLSGWLGQFREQVAPLSLFLYPPPTCPFLITHTPSCKVS